MPSETMKLGICQTTEMVPVMAPQISPGKTWEGVAGAVVGVLIYGALLGDFGNGLLVLALVAIAGTGQIGRAPGGDVPAKEQAAHAARHGPFLLLVALIIPAVALAGTFLFKWVPGLADPKQATLISLALGVLIALGVGMVRLKPPLLLPAQQGRRLLDAVGWAAILPQMLASLGAVFALAGVGEVVGDLIGTAIPHGSLFGAVLATQTQEIGGV